MRSTILITAIGSMLFSGASFGTLFEGNFDDATPVVINSTGLEASDVQITGIFPILGIDTNGDFIISDDPLTGLGYPINSTSFIGIETPDNDWGKDPSPNTGLLYEGLLNGETLQHNKKGTKTTYYLDPNLFLTNSNDSWVDEETVGWISLANSENDNSGEWISDDSYSSITAADGTVFNLNDFIDLSFNNSGDWSLFVDPTAIDAATAALGRPALFDHLTFVLKGSNKSDPSWAVFDFNFWDLIDDGLDISLGDTVYYFTGSWNTGVINNQDLSHVGIWAHDPPTVLTDNEIPEPSTLLLMAAAFAGLYTRRSLRRA
ncbi:PEP-CTERM sorting domain-containing protein [Halochromatium roseum]|uniref:PEP-CTERM sorting domain-containing protein n=1 Tax=Halochromatium roseum TaxID=391920 RepID=UPI00191497D5|nr:PEP-CTERM sorting domain-containing protein [Halochromatium roseum]